MKIANQTIVVPGENPLCYPLDWRSKLARAAAAAGLSRSQIRAQIADPDAQQYAVHLLQGNPRPNPYDRVTGWRDSGAGILLDAFLLAAPSYQDAANEQGLPADETRLYSRLFFDCRDEQGVIRSATRMLMLAQLGPQEQDDAAARLRRVALSGGIHGLRRVLWSSMPAKEPTLDELVESELTRRLHAGELRNGDLVRLHATAATTQRSAQDQGTDQRWHEGWDYARKLLESTAPRMAQKNLTEQEAATTSSNIQAKIQAQRAVGATHLEDDPQKGAAALDELLRSKMQQAG